MPSIEVKTQAELDKAIATRNPGDVIVCLGGTRWDRLIVRGNERNVVARGSAHVEARGSAHVVARGSAHVVALDSAHVVARESAHVVALDSAHVVARESAHVEARESAHVEARGSAHVVALDSAHVVARESAHVEARGSAHVEASKFVSVHRQSRPAKISGGVVIDVPDVATLSPGDWCDYYGVKVARGHATLYKAVDDDFATSRSRAANIIYTPGAKVAAPDFSTEKCCGFGLHASPLPAMALSYNPDATRFVAVKCKVADLIVIDDKVKAPRMTVLHEVDRYGEIIEQTKDA